MDIEQMIEEIKEAAIELGTEAISEIVGYSVIESDDLDGILEEAFDQMPEEEIEALYDKFAVRG